MEPSLDSEATYDPVNFSFPHGTHLCAMEVDTETGAVKMRKYVACDDIGNIINPLIVAGQVHGGLVQGIAQALWEEAVYDDERHPGVGLVRRLPAADGRRHDQLRHRPHHLAVDDQHAGHQGRGRGRHHRLDAGRGQRGGGCRPHFGVNDIQMPCTPERVWKAVQRRHAQARPRTPKGPRCRTSTRRTRPGQHGRSGRSDPRPVRLPRTDHGRGGAGGRWPSTVTRPRSSPVGRACCRCSGCGSTHRRSSSTSAGSTRCAGCATTATRSSSVR